MRGCNVMLEGKTRVDAKSGSSGEANLGNGTLCNDPKCGLCMGKNCRLSLLGYGGADWD
jgi:hypothetical protein